ncbi:hypothetical protein XarbCFBP7610_14275 [Xanthomonas arboricola]|nr:hypothetical protein XarbCFBP7614_08370 [Xanthomonas arboricola]PPU19088.1 hypothetical protein XarbCFBP7610_14275 [Xanthomonas arboricola]
MKRGWPRRQLKDCAKWYSGGTPSKGVASYWGGDIPWISSKSLTSFFVSDSEDRVTNEGAHNGTRLVPKDSILFVVRGMSLKTEFRMGIATRPVTFNQDVKALLAIDDVLPAYLAYAIKSKTNEILQMVGEAGHGTGVLPTDRMQSLEIPIPPIADQRAIARTLGNLDERIELNQRMDQTLEVMARALFRSWFVDFDGVAAGDMQESELGLIPKGWRVADFSKIVEIIGGGTPKTSVDEYWDGDIPWFSVVDTPAASDLFVTRTEKNITQAGANESSVRLIPKGATIISARGTVGNLALAGCEMTFNQSCYGLRGKYGVGDYFVFLAAQHMVIQLRSMAHGSVFSTITRQTFDAIKIAVPSEKILQRFEKTVAVWFEKILLNVQQSQALIQLRDTLLPKLLSGELRVKDAERMAETV